MKSLFPRAELLLIARLLSYSARHKPFLAFAALLGIVSAIAELCAVTSMIPLAALATGKGLPNHSGWAKIPALFGAAPDAKFFTVLFLSLLLFRMASYMATLISNAYIMQVLFAHFSSRAHASFVRHLEFQEIVKHQIGHFFSLAGDEANRGALIVVSVLRVVPVIFLFAIYVAAICYESPLAALILFVVLTGVVLSLRNAFRKSLALGKRQQYEASIHHTHFFDSLASLRTVRGFTAEDFVVDRYKHATEKYANTCFLNDALAQATQAPAILLVAISLAAVVLYADSDWIIRNLPLLLAAIMTFTRLLPIANQGLEAALRLAANLKAGESVSDMLRAVRLAEQEDKLPAFPSTEQIKKIEFKHVAFRYEANPKPVLDDFSCTLVAGFSYAIVGPSGAGKSSLIDLLLKFYDPAPGTILVNGRDIRNISTDSLRQHIILSEQVTRIYHGSVLENVQFGHERAKGQALSALSVVGLEETLEALPEGVDTQLAFQGNNFSGGQRQRIGMARALARTADVLILDESTNALDASTRERILEALTSMYRDRILIFVTHDQFLIDRVDRVIELSGDTKKDLMPVGTFATTPDLAS